MRNEDDWKGHGEPVSHIQDLHLTTCTFLVGDAEVSSPEVGQCTAGHMILEVTAVSHPVAVAIKPHREALASLQDRRMERMNSQGGMNRPKHDQMLDDAATYMTL